ncbi:MAG: PVC-type heme-binding CxxCH protein [Fuerstiella sp.]
MRRSLCAALLLIAYQQSASVTLAEETPPQNTDTNISFGPETEKRFPPLAVPDGFHVTLFACDPLIEYPSVIAIGPRPGSLFVAHDYVTGLGVEIVRRDEVRLIEDSDVDGYADRSTLYAGEFNSIQGLTFHDGSVFVMHAPLLTRLRDTDGDGIADERRDLIQGLGLPPEENSNRLHCANGVVAGHDGWLYLALGDRGCDVQRPEGDRLLFQQGGILRCRSDGSGLHVFSTGLRNIYDVLLDDELNVFVRDNENDGGDYMIRVCHCFFGSDHGYPYHYYERPDELMQPLADLGRGSSAGGTCYLEASFPVEYRESLFCCEWGRGVVRYHRSRRHSSFEPMTETDFAIGAKDDPYGFKPTDLVVDYDGSLLVSDWCDGQRPKRGRGRIYRISYGEDVDRGPSTMLAHSNTGTAIHIKQLDADSYHQRTAAQLELQKRGAAAVADVLTALEAGELGFLGRLHAIWIIATSAQKDVPHILFDLAAADPDPRIQAQAIRAIGDLTDPILVSGRIHSGRGDDGTAERIASIAERADPRVVLESLIVMRRLRWLKTPRWIANHLVAEDPALNHAAQQALCSAANWPEVVRFLDDSPRLRKLALQAIAEERIPDLAVQLIQRLQHDQNAERRREYADTLSRIVRKTEPWTYWGFRPDARPAATVQWEKTNSIENALNAALLDPDFDVRAFVLRRMLREGVVPELSVLAVWLNEDTRQSHVVAILESLKSRAAGVVQPLLTQTVERQELTEASRLVALSMLVDRRGDDAESLVQLAERLEDGPVLASVLRDFGMRPGLSADVVLLQKLDSASPIVRAEAIRSLGKRKNTSAVNHVGRLLKQTDADVRLAAAEAAGRLGATATKDTLLQFSAGSEPALVAASLNSLRRLEDDRAVSQAADALEHRETQLAALDYLKSFATPKQIPVVVRAAARNPSSDFQGKAVQTLVAWQKDFVDSRLEVQSAIASVHGHSGQPLAWHLSGPLSETMADELLQQLKTLHRHDLSVLNSFGAASVIAAGAPAALSFAKSATQDTDPVWIAWTPIRVDSATNIEVLTSATGHLSLWLDGDQIHTRRKSAAFRPDSDRFPIELNSGTSWLVARIEPGINDSPRFHLHFRRRSSKAEHEQLVAYALQSRGNVNRGREIFAATEKSLCIRCHRLGAQGGRIGPDLTGIGRRFSRIHLIESILEPSRTVAPSYATIVVAMNDGKVLSGIRVSETDELLVLGDNQGKLHQIARSDVEEITTQTVSTMPDGLEKKLTDREFADLLAFLESEKTPQRK